MWISAPGPLPPPEGQPNPLASDADATLAWQGELASFDVDPVELMVGGDNATSSPKPMFGPGYEDSGSNFRHQYGATEYSPMRNMSESWTPNHMTGLRFMTPFEGQPDGNFGYMEPDIVDMPNDYPGQSDIGRWDAGLFAPEIEAPDFEVY